MRLLSRDFTILEKAFVTALAFVLLGLGYFYFVDQPVRQQKAQYTTEQAELQSRLNGVNARLSRLQTWEAELDHTDLTLNRMPSYNSSSDEMEFLNAVLAGSRMQFSASFGNVTRSGNQIRRGFTLQLSAPGVETARETLYRLTHSQYRCILGNMDYAESYNEDGSLRVSIRADGTFYETMINGTPDYGLPANDMEEGKLDF